MLFECFLAFLGPKNAKKHSKSTLWGTPRQVPKIAQKALPKNLLRLFFRNNLTSLKITSEVKNNLKRLFLTLF